MEYSATAKYIRVNPRKTRLLADAVKELSPQLAMDKLQYLAKSAAKPILKTLKSAVANAHQPVENLKIKNIIVGGGARFKRRDTSHGARYDPGVIQKCTSHIKVILEDGK
jgi:large subunit ribosomal protein L22